MKHTLFLSSLISVFIWSYVAFPATNSCNRIISLAPSITETLHILGLMDKVEGVTKFCKFPPEAEKKAKIGGYFDLNLEQIFLLKPDIVIGFPEHSKISSLLNKKAINFLELRHNDLQAITDSISIIGDRCGKSEKAAAFLKTMANKKDFVKKLTQNSVKKTKVLVVVSKSYDGKTLRNVNIAASDGFYSEIIALAGGINGYSGLNIKYPSISQEGLLSINPDVIIDIIPTESPFSASEEEQQLKIWKSIPNIKAVKGNKVYIWSSYNASIPGPYFINLILDLALILNPSLKISKSDYFEFFK